MAPAAPHTGTAHLKGGIPLTGLSQTCSHSAIAVSEEKQAGVGMASPASLGGVRGPSPLPAVERTR